MSFIELEIRRIARKHALYNASIHDGMADLGVVIGRVIAERPDLRTKAKELKETVRSVVVEVNLLSKDEQLSEARTDYPELFAEKVKTREEGHFPPLPEAEMGKVVTRFPPEPNGYPHIGHAKAAIIDYTYAKMYDGKFILRFDDTNPAKEKLEYYDAIRNGLEWLQICPDIIKNASDDMEKFYLYALKMIEQEKSYVCLCDVDLVRSRRSAGEECECRKKSVEENLSRWEQMFSRYRQNEAILRLRVDMKSLNTALRDPTLMRIIETPHPVKGDKYRVWPTYDFSAPIEDSLDGVTHALRTKEYELRDPLYHRILEILGLRRPVLMEFSRLEMPETPLSKRKLTPLIEEGKVQGWDDPRLPTIGGLRRRGFLPQSIRDFVLSLGVSKTESEPGWEILESFNRKVVDPLAKRYFFVPDPIELKVKDGPGESFRIRLHPEKDLGSRNILVTDRFYISRQDASLKEGDRLRLIDLFNVTIDSIGDQGLKAHFAGMEVIPEIKKIQWVPEDRIEFRVLAPGRLFLGEKYSPESMKIIEGFAEPECSKLSVGELVQFVRFAFCRIDGPGVAVLTHK